MEQMKAEPGVANFPQNTTIFAFGALTLLVGRHEEHPASTR